MTANAQEDSHEFGFEDEAETTKEEGM